MNRRILGVLLSCLCVLVHVSAYANTRGLPTTKPTALPAHFALKNAVIGLDSEWNSESRTLFLKGENGFDFVLPGKKSAHIHFPRTLNAQNPISIKTHYGNILQHLVSSDTYQAQLIGKYLVYQGKRNAILYRYDADKRQLREFVYLAESSAMPENGEVIEWRFEGVDLKTRDDGSVVLSKTIDIEREINQVAGNHMAERINQFIKKRYSKESSKKPVTQTLLVIPRPEYVTQSGDVRTQGIRYQVKESNLTVIMASRVPLAYPLWVDPSLSADADSEVILDGQSANDQLGFSVSSAGDFNGDGLGDVIIGAPFDDNNALNDSGSAFIFFGGQAGTINNPDVNADVVLNGQNLTGLFGSDVSSAGDFNGDGLTDVIVGAPFNGLNGSAFIYFGGRTGTINNPETNADVVLNGQGTNDQFGTSVASAGDFDGNGIDDVIVGAPFDDNNLQPNSGSAFIYFGGQSGTINNPDTNANVVLNGEGQDDEFGASVDTAGDFDGDGIDDVVVGAPRDDNNGRDASGSAFIFYGGQTGTINNPDTNADVVLDGEGPGDQFGSAVASAGDFGGDGFGDVIVGAPLYEFFGAPGMNNLGKAYIFYGGPGSIIAPIDRPNEEFFGEENDDQFGASVASAGDVNGDGLPDVIVGAPFGDNLETDSGNAYIFFGRRIGQTINPNNRANLEINGDGLDDQFGISVGSAGDFNGDGLDDVLVGAHLNNNNSLTDSGSAYIRFGRLNLNSEESADVILTHGGGNADQFGFEIGSAGDFNGDGNDDLIVSARLNDAGGFINSGSAFIFFGPQNGPITDPENTADVVMNGSAGGTGLGVGAASIGDFNGDGLDDVAVSTPTREIDPITHERLGVVYIIFGGRTGTIDDLDTNADVIFNAPDELSSFGSSVRSAGDFNGDGLGDIIIAAGFNDNNGLDGSGSAYIFFGSLTAGGTINNPDTTADVVLNGQSVEDRFGSFVSYAGDFNGDGLDDVIVVAPNDDNNGRANSGSAFIFFGGQTGTINNPDTNADVVLNGQNANDGFGGSVASAGDFNGDGMGDVIVGAPTDDNNGLTDSGSAFIFFGGRTGTINDPETNADVVVNGQDGNDRLGQSVGPAGDFNGDGLDDAIVGATSDNNIGNSSGFAGNAFIFFGGQTGTINDPDLNANVVLNGTGALENFGSKVNSAGDFNGDGRPDVAVRSVRDASDVSNSGRVFIFSSPLNSIAIPTASNAHNDFNADSNSDLLLIQDSGVIANGQLDNSVLQTLDGVLQVDPAQGWTLNSTGDFNGDRKADLLLYNTTTGEYRTVLLDGAAILSDTVFLTLDPSIGLVPQGTGDFDGNGRDEVLIFQPNGGFAAIIFFDSNGIPTSLEAVTEAVDTANNWTLRQSGDFNGDNKTDLLLYNTVSGTTGYFQMDGSAVTATTLLFALDPATGWLIEEAGDFSGNGSTDILLLHTSGVIAIITLENGAVLSFYSPGGLPADNEIVNAGRYDSDNKDDLLMRNTVTGDIRTAIQDGALFTSFNTFLNIDPTLGWTVHSGKP